MIIINVSILNTQNNDVLILFNSMYSSKFIDNYLYKSRRNKVLI